MKVPQSELFKIKNEYQNSFSNKVFTINSGAHYSGRAFVYAKNVEEANKQIENFKKADKNNEKNSWGYGSVDETDFTGKLTDEGSKVTGGIYYYG